VKGFRFRVYGFRFRGLELIIRVIVFGFRVKELEYRI